METSSEWYDITDFWPPPDVTVWAIVGDIHHRKSKTMVKLVYCSLEKDRVFEEVSNDMPIADSKEDCNIMKNHYMIAWKHIYKRGTYHGKEDVK